MAKKYTVVGGVAIPNYVKGLAALTGLSGVFTYFFHREMKSMHGEKYPDSITRFMTGQTVLVAGGTAHLLYAFNENLALKREMDKKVLSRITIRMFPTTAQVMYSAGSLMVVAYGLCSMTNDLVKMKAIHDNEAGKGTD